MNSPQDRCNETLVSISMTNLLAHQTAVARELSIENYARWRYGGDHLSHVGLKEIVLSDKQIASEKCFQVVFI